MRLATLTITLLLANAALASNNNPASLSSNGFDASNSAEFSGYQQYSQNNYSNGDNYRINNVTCPTPTLYVGGNGSHADYKGFDPKSYGIAVGVQIPLFTGRCEDAVNVEIRKMQWQLVDSQQAAIERNEMHNLEKARMCAFMVEKGFEPPENYCQDVQKVAMNEDLESIFVK